jgi:hypothetical protein
MANLFRSIRKLGSVAGEVIDATANGAETVIDGAKDVVPELSKTGANLVGGVVFGAKVINRASNIIRELSPEAEVVGLKLVLVFISSNGLIALINKATSEPESDTGIAYKMLKEHDEVMNLALSLAEREVKKFISKDYKTIKQYKEDLEKLKESLSSLEITLVHKLKTMIDGE